MRRMSRNAAARRPHRGVRGTGVLRVRRRAVRPAAEAGRSRCTIASARVRTPSLSKIGETWLRTVFSLLPSCFAIAWLSRPRATSSSTAVSATVSAGFAGRRGARRAARAGATNARNASTNTGHAGSPSSSTWFALSSDEARARDRRGQVATFLERNGQVVARVHDQRRHPDLRRRPGDVDLRGTSRAFAPRLRRSPSAAAGRSTSGAARVCRRG